MSKIKIIDSIMGSGKTESIINKINSSNKDENFIYITPYLDECNRIKNSCKHKYFIEPDEIKMGTKTRHFKNLASKGYNIVSTHSLFKGADEELLEILNAQNYTLILDEVLDVVEPLKISKKDLKEILERYAHVDKDTNELVWDDLEYFGNHIEVKNMAINGSLIVINGVILLWNFPVDIFKAFKEVYLLTYLFDYQIQKYYYDYYDIEFEKYSLDRIDGKNTIVDYGKSNFEKDKICNIGKLINIYDGKLNNIGDNDNSLSKSWFEKNKNSVIMNSLKRNIYTYFKTNTKTKSKVNGWATFKDYENLLAGDGYTRGFIPLNMRASNKYNHKTSLAYITNRYMNPFVKQMFINKGINVNENLWALSEMLQWLWRGAIRVDEKMEVYIPSKRMREMLQEWLKPYIHTK